MTTQHTPSADELHQLADQWDECCDLIDAVMSDAGSIGESKAMRTCAKELRAAVAKANGSAA